ncbi:MAG: branched-chain amino acid ABC transporter permease [Mycobacteriales bacterium]|nr:branched-chain amino acid ABC transporter permease [Frankia sp.]
MSSLPECFTANFWNLTISGLAIGSVYALIALGYTLVYGVLQLINFAHSEVFMAGAFAGLIFSNKVIPDTATPGGLASVMFVLGGVLVGAAAGGGVAIGLERLAYRPLRRRNAPRLAFLISAIGASLLLFNLASKLFGKNPYQVEDPFRDHTLFTVFGARVSLKQVVVAVCAAVMLVFLDRFVNGTKLGKGIRSVAQDAETASLMGVDIDRIITITFLVGGLLGGAAGYLYGLTYNVKFDMGFLPGVKAFTAAVLGGIGNVRGAVLGGLLLGMAENLGVSCISIAWTDVVAFLILVLVLVFRPSGILGERLGRSA